MQTVYVPTTTSLWGCTYCWRQRGGFDYGCRFNAVIGTDDGTTGMCLNALHRVKDILGGKNLFIPLPAHSKECVAMLMFIRALYPAIAVRYITRRH